MSLRARSDQRDGANTAPRPSLATTTERLGLQSKGPGVSASIADLLHKSSLRIRIIPLCTEARVPLVCPMAAAPLYTDPIRRDRSGYR